MLSFLFGQLLLLVPLAGTAGANCTVTMSGSSSGNCASMEYSYSCDGTNGDPLESCSGGFGFCDWGDVTAFWSYDTCGSY